MRSDSMTVGTHYLALFNLRLQCIKTYVSVPSNATYVELLLATHMIELHDIKWVALLAIQTRDAFGIPNKALLFLQVSFGTLGCCPDSLFFVGQIVLTLILALSLSVHPIPKPVPDLGVEPSTSVLSEPCSNQMS